VIGPAFTGVIGGADHRCVTCHTYHRASPTIGSGVSLEALFAPRRGGE
jgi:hypothetical protein